jgi:subtilase family serine protease
MNPRFAAAFLTVSLSATLVAPAGATGVIRGFLSPAERGVAADVARTHGDVRDLGRMAANNPVHIGVLMRYQHEAELERLTLLQGDRRSPYFHHYLSVAQWNSYFAPAQATYLRTQQTLLRAGFRIEGTFRNRGMIVATAPAGIAERFFHTELHQVVQAKRRGLRYVNVTPAIMPAELRSDVVGVAGLHSIVNMHFPLRMGPRRPAYSRVAMPEARAGVTPAIVPTANATPKPITTSTPGPNPSPDATESPEDPLVDYATYQGYGPPIWAEAYDYPVEHGYGGSKHAAGSVIDSDFSDADSAIEYSTFNIPRTGTTNRVCTDLADQCTICNDTNATTTAATCDPEGESTLDAQTIMTLAPAVNFYEYLVNSTTSLIDLNVETAYERVVSDDIVDVVNSSFGGCETDDPSEEYAVNYIAMEGAAEGITFSASSGDTGAYSCGVYITNGAPQTELNISIPAGADYFTGVGGSSFDPDLTPGTYYITAPGVGQSVQEQAWLDGGGGHSEFEPIPSWQVAEATAASPLALVSTTMRNIPDLVLTADGGAVFIGGTQGVGLVDTYNGTTGPTGGTSLSSPMWVAMQTEINQVQGSKNGFVNPRLYAIAAASTAEYAFGFHDIFTSTNGFYTAETGYDDATGLGSPKGWELAGTE